MNKAIAPAVLLLLAAHAAAASAGTGSARHETAHERTDSGTSGSSRQESSATLIGRNGLVRIGGDTIEARNGRLTVNGLPYGEVGDKSVIRYTVKGKDKTLTVDGVVRTPSTVKNSR